MNASANDTIHARRDEESESIPSLRQTISFGLLGKAGVISNCMEARIRIGQLRRAGERLSTSRRRSYCV
jgi:hypothetical protein